MGRQTKLTASRRLFLCPAPPQARRTTPAPPWSTWRPASPTWCLCWGTFLVRDQRRAGGRGVEGLVTTLRSGEARRGGSARPAGLRAARSLVTAHRGADRPLGVPPPACCHSHHQMPTCTAPTTPPPTGASSPRAPPSSCEPPAPRVGGGRGMPRGWALGALCTPGAALASLLPCVLSCPPSLLRFAGPQPARRVRTADAARCQQTCPTACPPASHPSPSLFPSPLLPTPPLHRRWDAWARLTEPLLATVPAVYIAGNHEIEMQVCC